MASLQTTTSPRGSLSVADSAAIVLCGASSVPDHARSSPIDSANTVTPTSSAAQVACASMKSVFGPPSVTRTTGELIILSGPCGVGKSTTGRELRSINAGSIRFEGDVFLDMLDDGYSWDERISLSWHSIFTLAAAFVKRGSLVIVDFVVEDDATWVHEQLRKYDIHSAVRYAVLFASPDTLRERIAKRGDAELMDRSLFLREKIVSQPANAPFLYDTTSALPKDVASCVQADPRFRLQ